MIARICVVLLIGSANILSARGQSIYVDFSDWEGTVSSNFGAAATPGVWNTYNSPTDNFLESLYATNGERTNITMSLSSLGSSQRVFSSNKSDSFGDSTPLLNDFMYSFSFDLRLEFTGLQNSKYKVYTYAVFDSLFQGSNDSLVWVQDNATYRATIEGEWQGEFARGITHSVHDALVTDGTLSISLLSPIATINGIQIVQVPSPPAIALFTMGLITTLRRRR